MSCRKRNKKFVERIKVESGCVMCGESDPRVLQFHHLDPHLKVKKISKLVEGYSLEKLQEEIDKCSIVCSNCHLKIHSPL